ncbi:MAG: PLP-dependent aminotransferase family protein [Alphaproteobacteria bacterium]|nr:PLP-dependent aminotransferase family protein [Alphaproteobacteria bacterium]MBU1516250.1 PLP-dependent aminotransferase family protein [Alphaproteobacteria bacterium]MBU2095787.1 PLP-dependent aminotransferase family protein [Alphaproteobacteria bacterium]MBU2151903.1 PLP-dependent aminotransferase family protein [Alphaproteobacteria bacterium]MBU2306814.1 PLP-dependent aminotransferase family protein [Alphaproteobacteria bacterium]
MSTRRIGPASLTRLLGAWRGERTGPAYRQLADGLRLLVLDGRLPLDVVLPGERELAQALEVSRTTVTAALGRLRDDGFLDRRQGAGARTRLPGGPGERGMASLLAGSEGDGLIDMASAAPPAAEQVHQAFVSAISALPAHLPNHGYAALGLPILRETIAARYTRRGLPTMPDQIMVTNGAQHALALMLRLTCGPGDRVVIDHPTYPHAIDAIQRASCRPAPVGLPGEGWDVEGVAAALRQSGPRLAYFIADFHNPTGRWMTPQTRTAIVEAAARARTTLIFDETLIDLALDLPIQPYAFDEPDEGLVRLGSTGKSFWGGLRLGWIRADVPTIQALAARRSSIDLGTPILEQLAVVHLLGDEDATLDARRAMLRGRRDHLIRAVGTALPDWKVTSPPGGLSLWAELPAPVSTALAATSERFGVRLAAGPRFGVDGAFERFLRLPYTLAPEVLTDAVDRLAQAYGRLQPGQVSSRAHQGAVV